MKKLLLIMMLALASLFLFSCEKEENNKYKIVTSIFPQYDFVKVITEGSDNFDLILLQEKGSDLHSFQPTVKDMVNIKSADLFIYVGGESDKWVKDALKDVSNKNQIDISLMDIVEVKEEEEKEGMEEEHEEEHEEVEYDEHVWLSLNNASIIVKKISDAIIQIDPENETLYRANTSRYLMELKALDMLYQEAVTLASKKVIVVGDRFPFRYLVDDYGIDYYAAFKGCSAEVEASFETVIFLSKKVDELGLSAIIKLENNDGRIANQIKQNTKNKDQQILVLDSMQSQTLKDYRSYLEIMQSNLEVLKQALN